MKNDLYIQSLLNRISLSEDELAFQQLFDLFAHDLSRFTYSLLKNKELAEETVSDVFFKIWVHRGKMSEIENFKAYLYMAARNIALNYLDKEKRKKVVSLEDISVPLHINEICPESELITIELKEAIGKAIDNLPERCKLIYSMAKLDELKYKEIAQILNISVKTIDHQLTIAIKKIANEIHNFLGEQSSTDKFTVLLHLFLPRN